MKAKVESRKSKGKSLVGGWFYFRLSPSAFLLCCALALAAAAAEAQQYPARPARIVVPVSAGGGVDTLARIVAEHFSVTWGQRFIVDNRPGAGTSIGA